MAHICLLAICCNDIKWAILKIVIHLLLCCFRTDVRAIFNVGARAQTSMMGMMVRIEYQTNT